MCHPPHGRGHPASAAVAVIGGSLFIGCHHISTRGNTVKTESQNTRWVANRGETRLAMLWLFYRPGAEKMRKNEKAGRPAVRFLAHAPSAF